MGRVSSTTLLAERVSWNCALLAAVLLVMSCCEVSDHSEFKGMLAHDAIGAGNGFSGSCDEIYVVKEGETLHTISEKCGDPFIVERNPHIHDPDDVFPGLVIKVTPSGFK